MRKYQSSTNKLWLLVFFGAILLIIVGVSLALKFISLVHDSSYDGEHVYVVNFSNSKDNTIVSFQPKNKSIGIIRLNEAGTNTVLQQTLSIPIDGKVEGMSISASTLPSDLLRMAFMYQSIKTDLTILDISRLAFFANTGAKTNIKEVDPKEGILYLFIDPVIQQEQVDVEIINASGVSGLGQRLEQMLSHVGINVISVTTASKSQDKSRVIHFGQKTYTLLKIQNILNILTDIAEKKPLANITITLGKDMAETKIF